MIATFVSLVKIFGKYNIRAGTERSARGALCACSDVNLVFGQAVEGLERLFNIFVDALGVILHSFVKEGGTLVPHKRITAI